MTTALRAEATIGNMWQWNCLDVGHGDDLLFASNGELFEARLLPGPLLISKGNRGSRIGLRTVEGVKFSRVADLHSTAQRDHVHSYPCEAGVLINTWQRTGLFCGVSNFFA